MESTISKYDVINSLLKTAITLFFEERDPISVHLLASSSHQILHDISGRKLSFIKTTPKVKEEDRKTWLKYVHKAQNFFKHSLKDSNETLEFNSGQTDFIIFDAIGMYQELFNINVFKEAQIYIQWFRLKYPNLFQESELKNMILEGLESGIRPDKQIFLKIINRKDI